MSNGKKARFAAAALSGALCAATVVGCQSTVKNSFAPRRDINAVLAAHDQALMALPGVVGVYVGLHEDGRTPCLKVMLARQTPENRHAIPRQLEGYPVVTEVSGRIRPLAQ